MQTEEQAAQEQVDALRGLIEGLEQKVGAGTEAISAAEQALEEKVAGIQAREIEPQVLDAEIERQYFAASAQQDTLTQLRASPPGAEPEGQSINFLHERPMPGGEYYPRTIKGVNSFLRDQKYKRVLSEKTEGEPGVPDPLAVPYASSGQGQTIRQHLEGIMSTDYDAYKQEGQVPEYLGGTGKGTLPLETGKGQTTVSGAMAILHAVHKRLEDKGFPKPVQAGDSDAEGHYDTDRKMGMYRKKDVQAYMDQTKAAYVPPTAAVPEERADNLSPNSRQALKHLVVQGFQAYQTENSARIQDEVRTVIIGPEIKLATRSATIDVINPLKANQARLETKLAEAKRQLPEAQKALEASQKPSEPDLLAGSASAALMHTTTHAGGGVLGATVEELAERLGTGDGAELGRQQSKAPVAASYAAASTLPASSLPRAAGGGTVAAVIEGGLSLSRGDDGDEKSVLGESGDSPVRTSKWGAWGTKSLIAVVTGVLSVIGVSVLGVLQAAGVAISMNAIAMAIVNPGIVAVNAVAGAGTLTALTSITTAGTIAVFSGAAVALVIALPLTYAVIAGLWNAAFPSKPSPIEAAITDCQLHVVVSAGSDDPTAAVKGDQAITELRKMGLSKEGMKALLNPEKTLSGQDLEKVLTYINTLDEQNEHMVAAPWAREMLDVLLDRPGIKAMPEVGESVDSSNIQKAVGSIRAGIANKAPAGSSVTPRGSTDLRGGSDTGGPREPLLGGTIGVGSELTREQSVRRGPGGSE